MLVQPPLGELSYICIYNTTLDPTERRLADQIVFFYGGPNDDVSPIPIEQQLRFMGLTQGVVEFSKGFAQNAPVSSMETGRSRIVLKKLEDPAWWIVACISFPKVQSRHSPNGQHSSRDISSAEILIADLVKAYRRWRLHNGTFQAYLDSHGRQALVNHLAPWWRPWALNWIVNVHGSGFCNLFNDIRMARGNLSHETVEAIKAAVLTKDTDKGLVQILISNHPPSEPFDYTVAQGAANVESCGCVWAAGTVGNENHEDELERQFLSPESVADITSWVIDCESYLDDSAFLEPSGYIYHLDRRVRRESAISVLSSESSSSSLSIAPSSTLGIAGPRAPPAPPPVPTPAPASKSDSSSLLKNPAVLFSALPHAAASTVTSVAKGSIDGLSSLMYYSTFGLINVNKASSPEAEIAEGPADDINDSRFLVGFEGTLDEDSSIKPATPISEQPEADSDDIAIEDDDDDDANATQFSYKRLLLSSKESPDVYEPFNIVIFRRRPFVFTLVFKPQSTVLSDKEYYLSLYRRLASLTEPIYADLNAASIKHHRHKKHHHNHPATTPPGTAPAPLSNAALSYAAPIPATAAATLSPSSPQQQQLHHIASKKKKFYYLVHDPKKHVVQYSLPEIISYQTLFQLAQQVKDCEDDPEFQTALVKRDELIHVHQAMAHIALPRHKDETEKFTRTAKGWWIYWSKLADERQVVVARKWNKPGKPPADPINGLLSALGTDGASWLDEYKASGRV